MDYYNPDVITTEDYSSFGALLPGRKYGNTPRYTYNGKQLDQETGWQEYGIAAVQSFIDDDVPSRYSSGLKNKSPSARPSAPKLTKKRRPCAPTLHNMVIGKGMAIKNKTTSWLFAPANL